VMKMKSPDEKLSEVLTEWRVAPAPSAGFRPGVWAKIGRAGRDVTWTGFVRARAMPCALLVAGALIVGAWTGREQARGRVEAGRAEILKSYVSGLDARTMAMR
jgi:hypothetical protein